MRAGAAEVESLDRHAIAAPAGYRTHEQNLVESQLAMVEAGRRRLGREAAGLDVEKTCDGSDEAVAAPGDVLHVHFGATVRALQLDVRRRGIAPVLGVVVGALEVIERGRYTEVRRAVDRKRTGLNSS